MATVIKVGEQKPQLIKRLETLNVTDHLGEAQLVVKTSRAKARELLRDTQVEAATIRKEADEKGYQAGFRRGYEAGTKAGYEAAFEAARKDFAADQGRLVEVVKAMIAGFEERKRDLFIAASRDVVHFAVKVAEKVTRQVGVVNRESAAANLEAALRLVESKTNLVVRINPLDQSTIERFAESFKERAEGARNLSITVDESIAPGGCHLVTPEAEVDATLDTQIEQLASLMVQAQERSS